MEIQLHKGHSPFASLLLQPASPVSSRRMLGTLNAPSVLYTAPAMTRQPPSVTVIKASTGLSKTPPPWLVQVSRQPEFFSLSCLQESNFCGCCANKHSIIFVFLDSFCCLSFNSVIESHLNVFPPSLNTSECCISETDKLHAGMKHLHTLKAIHPHAYTRIFEDVFKQFGFFSLYRCENWVLSWKLTQVVGMKPEMLKANPPHTYCTYTLITHAEEQKYAQRANLSDYGDYVPTVASSSRSHECFGEYPSQKVAKSNEWVTNKSQSLNTFLLSLGPPSAPRNLVSLINDTALFLQWMPPSDTGGRKDITYNILCQRCGGSDSSSVVTQCEPCDSDLHFIPRPLGITGTSVAILDFAMHANYTFHVEAVNGVSGLGMTTRSLANVTINTHQAGKSCSFKWIFPFFFFVPSYVLFCCLQIELWQ